MAHKLNIIREIIPEKSPIQIWAKSPVGWWRVTTEGDCEGKEGWQEGNPKVSVPPACSPGACEASTAASPGRY